MAVGTDTPPPATSAAAAATTTVYLYHATTVQCNCCKFAPPHNLIFPGQIEPEPIKAP